MWVLKDLYRNFSIEAWCGVCCSVSHLWWSSILIRISQPVQLFEVTFGHFCWIWFQGRRESVKPLWPVLHRADDVGRKSPAGQSPGHRQRRGSLGGRQAGHQHGRRSPGKDNFKVIRYCFQQKIPGSYRTRHNISENRVLKTWNYISRLLINLGWVEWKISCCP